MVNNKNGKQKPWWKRAAKVVLAPFKARTYRKLVKDMKHRPALKRRIKEGNYDNIFVSVTIPFGYEMFQRPQHLALQLAELGNLIIYADSPHRGTERHNDNIYFTDIPYALSKNIPPMPGKRKFLYTSLNASHLPLANLLEMRAKGFEIILEYLDEISEEICLDTKIPLENYRNLEKIDPFLIITTAQKLYGEIIARFPEEKVLFSPNGVDMTHFLTIDSSDIPEDMKAILNQGKPIVGYYGALAPWLNYDLLNILSERMPHYNFVYIGVNYMNALPNLELRSNVFYLGSRNYRDLPKYSVHFDVCTIPFKDGEIAKSTSPLKLFEYIAVKKPVIVTKDLLECLGYDGVLVSRDANEFLANIDKGIALGKEPAVRESLFASASANTWQQRARDIHDRVNQLSRQ